MQDNLPEIKKNTSKNEMKFYGVNACQALFLNRPQDLIRVYVDSQKVKNFSKILKHCAEKKIAYKIIPADELNKVTESTHHEGICILAKKKNAINFKKFLEEFQIKKQEHCCVVVLEGVENPHNIGAILRVCANFSVDGLLISEPKLAQSAAAYRTSEGGAEWVRILETGELPRALEVFKQQGFQVLGTSSRGGKSLAKTAFPKLSVIIFGSEADGISSQISKMCDQSIYIPQSGRVESLNVACAASVILYEFVRNNSSSTP